MMLDKVQPDYVRSNTKHTVRYAQARSKAEEPQKRSHHSSQYGRTPTHAINPRPILVLAADDAGDSSRSSKTIEANLWRKRQRDQAESQIHRTSAASRYPIQDQNQRYAPRRCPTEAQTKRLRGNHKSFELRECTTFVPLLRLTRRELRCERFLRSPRVCSREFIKVSTVRLGGVAGVGARRAVVEQRHLDEREREVADNTLSAGYNLLERGGKRMINRQSSAHSCGREAEMERARRYSSDVVGIRVVGWIKCEGRIVVGEVNRKRAKTTGRMASSQNEWKGFKM